ncbi:metal ABC transporter solute-binding protein, Zn/Mn family [Cytobacillus praedii]|uniref:metal ABC transporter solute-binding protein, Zn/Mn family n=1 Tax=Cytobacillus praedii TaxID=1742358 RepID=UPI002E2320D1|nr:zinc ABC transporter substrate-binding protein [Cytobacillus praedii]MED3570671.1 zinc ABC transporter substrate-binding protein [Cytobacillus praedii]
MKKTIFVIILMITMLITGCTNESKDEQKDSSKLSVYTTVYPLQYFTDRIGGEYVETKTIYPPGADEHSFEPTQKDMTKLADADLFIFVGLGLEGFVEKAQKTLENEDVTMLGAGENIHFDQVQTHEEEEHEEDHSHDDDGHHHGDVDPHVWIDPMYAKDLAEAIKTALTDKMPEHKDEFEANYRLLTDELDQLNADFEQTIHNAAHKEIIVSHSAFGYWEQRYGLHQISVSGLNSANEPTQKDLEKIIAEGKKHQLKYVFFEQNVSSKLTEIIKNELGAEPLILHNLSVLTDEDISNKSTYFSIMEANLESLKTALNN